MSDSIRLSDDGTQILDQETGGVIQRIERGAGSPNIKYVYADSQGRAYAYHDERPMAITLRSGDEVLQIPIPPEKLEVAADAKIDNTSYIDIGDIADANGNVPSQVTWESWLPGRMRANDTWLIPEGSWRDPLFYVEAIRRWKANNARVNVTAPGTEVMGWDMMIASFNTTSAGGWGDIGYAIKFVQYIERYIYTEEELEARRSSGAAAMASVGAIEAGSSVALLEEETAARTEVRDTPNEIVILEDDSLWAIAKRAYGVGERWPEIYAVPQNQEKIGPDHNVLSPSLVGDTLVIP